MGQALSWRRHETLFGICDYLAPLPMDVILELLNFCVDRSGKNTVPANCRP